MWLKHDPSTFLSLPTNQSVLFVSFGFETHYLDYIQVRSDQIMAFRISRSQRLLAVIAIACSFFLAEISGMLLSCFYSLGMNGLASPWLAICFDMFLIWKLLRHWRWCWLGLVWLTDWLNGAVGFYTHSLALVADAFHYVCFMFPLTDVGGLVTLTDHLVAERFSWIHRGVCCCPGKQIHHACNRKNQNWTNWQHQVSEKDNPPKSLTFGWQRSQLLGAFFNGALLFALGISIFLQSIERFVSLKRWFWNCVWTVCRVANIEIGVENPKMILIMGCVGFGLNVVSALFLHGMYAGKISGKTRANSCRAWPWSPSSRRSRSPQVRSWNHGSKQRGI